MALPNAVIDTAASGNTTLVAAPGAGKCIVVYFYMICSNGVTTVRLRDSGGKELTGPIYATGAANGGVAASSSAYTGGLFFCDPNTALVVNNSLAIAIGGHVNYSIVG